MAQWNKKASCRQAVRACASPILVQKERPFFSTFDDEERVSLFLELKGFGVADSWPAPKGALRRRLSTVCWQAVRKCTERWAAQQDSFESVAH